MEELYGSLINYDEVKGYTYIDKYSGINPNKVSYHNIYLEVDGEKILIDEIIFFISPQNFNIVTGALEDIDKIVSDAGNPKEGPAYKIMGKLASETIRTRSGVTISVDQDRVRGRVHKGWIIVKENNHKRLETILQRRTQRIVMDYVNKNYSGSSKQKLIQWLKSNKYIK